MTKCANCEMQTDQISVCQLDGKHIEFCPNCFEAFEWGWVARDSRGGK